MAMPSPSRRSACSPRAGLSSRRGFTLLELLVTIAIMAGLTALLMPAIAAVREAGRRHTCASNLQNLSRAVLNHLQSKGSFPPGLHQKLFKEAPVYRGTTWIVRMLPYLDQNTLYSEWDFEDPLKNTDGGDGARTAMRFNWLRCPSDTLNTELANDGRWTYALTSYGGNGGTRSYFPSSAITNGIFHTTGPGSEPKKEQRPVMQVEVTDGLENTVLLGERDHYDIAFEEFATSGGGPPLNSWGWWAASGGRRSIGHITLSAAAPINYRHPLGNRSDVRDNAPYYSDLRLTAFGSRHPGGANFAFAGGSVRFLNESMGLAELQALCTRNGGTGK